MALFVLGFATLLSAAAALQVSRRAQLAGRAEVIVAATLVWTALIIAPIYVLGFLHQLEVKRLAFASLATSGLVLAISARGRPPKALFAELWRETAGLLSAPVEALSLAWRARSPILPGLCFTFLLLAYCALSAYYAPPFPHWDSLWYHETIVGFTIQNRGFAVVDLPETLQMVNGYPRLGEMLQLWFTIFAGRRLIDLANVLFAPALMASVYLLIRRYNPDKVTAIGWSAALAVMPGCAIFFQSTFVDPLNAALLLGAIVFATREPQRLRDVWFAALGLALAIGSKTLSLAPVAAISLVLVVATWRGSAATRRAPVMLAILGGAALIGLMTSAVYLRNYLHFHNPFWPAMKVEIKALGIHWPGLLTWSPDPSRRDGWRIDMNEPIPALLRHFFSLPFSVKQMYFDQAVEYGIGVIWVVLPLGALAVVACVFDAIRGLVRRRGEGGDRATEPASPRPIWLIALLFVILRASPALWCPRYHIVSVGLLIAIIAWFTKWANLQKVGEAAAAMVLVTSMMMVYWAQPAIWVTPQRMWQLVTTPYPNREMDKALGAAVNLPVATARERELGPGSVLAFNDSYSAFPALFWNNDFSNRLVYLKSGPDFLQRAAGAGATWVFLNDRDPLVPTARAAGSGWQDVGVLNAIMGGHAYRRVSP